MTREETLLVKEIVEQSDRVIHFLIKKNGYISLPKEVKEYFAFIDKAFNDLFIEMTVNKRYINSKLIGVCLPLSGSWDITRESFCNMIGNEKEYDKKLNDSIQKEMDLRREVTYETTSKDYKSYKRKMELLKLMTEQKEVNKNEL